MFAYNYYVSLPSCMFTYSKMLFEKMHNFVHLNLAIALFAAYMIFGFGIELASAQKVQK